MLAQLGPSQKTKKIAALDTLRANVMIADTNLNITYMNESLIKLMREAESDLKRELPRFSLATLIGSNIDIFHRNPAHQRNMLSRLEREHNATIKVGQRMFDLVVNPLKNGAKRVGFVVEWSDANERLRNVDYAAQNAAFGRSNAMISFLTDGTIVHANPNFLALMGYTLAEVVGQHHRIFMGAEARATPEYTAFWQKLAKGEFQQGDFKRFTKDGKQVWVQGSYNPVLDASGKVIRVEKFVVDVTRRVSSVAEVGATLSRLADGDLEVRVANTLSPELDQLRLDLNRALDRLQASMQGVGQSASAIAQGAEEIKSAADDLSMRTERQAANLEETAAALEEITAAVKATSENSGKARAIVENAKAGAETSATVVRKAVEAMRAIEESSQQIGQIIGVIDEIAFQTNLLALNAGVEAARAGDAGRGFAVVASEVRALAQRSAEAAKEIKALISTSAKQVEAGVGLVAETGQALEHIVVQVSEINGMVSTIAASAQEQASGLQGVNQAVNEMDRVTQQNAAMVEETTAAARSLADETGSLSGRVGQFKLGAKAKVAGPAARGRMLEKV